MTSKELLALHSEITAMRERLIALRKACLVPYRADGNIAEAVGDLHAVLNEIRRAIGDAVVEEAD